MKNGIIKFNLLKFTSRMHFESQLFTCDEMDEKLFAEIMIFLKKIEINMKQYNFIETIF